MNEQALIQELEEIEEQIDNCNQATFDYFLNISGFAIPDISMLINRKQEILDILNKIY